MLAAYAEHGTVASRERESLGKQNQFVADCSTTCSDADLLIC